MSAIYFYAATLISSIVMTALYMLLWRKHDDVHITLMFLLIPVVNLAHFLLATSKSQEAVLLATKLTYLGGTFLQLMIMLAIFGLCRIHLQVDKALRPASLPYGLRICPHDRKRYAILP